MKKKIFTSFICIAVSVLGLCACGKSSEGVLEADTAVFGSYDQGIEVLETESGQKSSDTEHSQETSEAEQDQKTNNNEQDQETNGTGLDREGVAVEKYTYEELSATMYAKSSVNVRDLPCKDGKQLGKLGQYDEVTVTGKCNETGWYRIRYNNGTAFVSGNYLLTESEKDAAIQKAQAEADKKAAEEANNKAQADADKKNQSDSSKESQTNNDNSIDKNVSLDDSSQETEKKDPEWIMWESASNKYLTQAQKEHIDGMVKKWLDDSSYTNEQLDNDLVEYLVSIGINIGFGEPEPCVDSFGIYKYDDITLNKKKQSSLDRYEQMVREDATVYEFRAFYTKWEYYTDGSLIVYDCNVII